MDNPWKTLTIRQQYDSPWICTEEHDVINPAGKQSIYSKVCFKNIAVAIIPLTENHETYLVGQFRYPTQSYEWEVCEGGCPIGTSPVATAKRELIEECGITAQIFTEVLHMQLSNAATDEVSYTYVAQQLTFGNNDPEETEQLTIKKMPFAQVFEMAMNGEIKDGLSVASIFKVQLMIEKGLL